MVELFLWNSNQVTCTCFNQVTCTCLIWWLVPDFHLPVSEDAESYNFSQKIWHFYCSACRVQSELFCIIDQIKVQTLRWRRSNTCTRYNERNKYSMLQSFLWYSIMVSEQKILVDFLSDAIRGEDHWLVVTDRQN